MNLRRLLGLCEKCGTSRKRKDGACAACAQWKSDRKGMAKSRGWAEGEFEKAEQARAVAEVCAACGGPPGPTGWHADHDHATGKFRGILCQGCNVALGCVKDTPARLRRLAAYLEGVS